MDLDLTGRHALVCGASQGIGQAAAVALAGLGATVTVLARNPAKLASLRPVLAKAGAPETHMLVADMDDRAGLRAAVAAHLETAGPIHILVNNTGGPAGGPLLEAKEEELVKAHGRHLLASHLLAQLTVPGMREAGYGRIVNVLSSSVREPILGLGVSNTVRAGMAAWSKTLSKELPPHITVNSVLPGYIDTERLATLSADMGLRSGKGQQAIRDQWVNATPEGRLGRPSELGDAIAFLCSPAASFIRGIVLPIDGGRLNTI
ncbi:MAG: 3-oxoacyl-[acyl-carrier protein] reductase [Thermoplasmata archaeon]|jgi:3-oxoacyl-[acyl-carrier protein] reductase|nr:3-oxoacyl-[acyl-carrier protein] reductase [Thermoplasmata archaeon]